MRRWPLVAALAAAVGVVATQPVASPWWVYADADATYSGSALNIAAGYHTRYFDHPGLPIQEAGAVVFGLWHAVGGHAPLVILLDLDSARPVYRTIAIAIYLLGAATAWLVGTRLLGGPLWGLATTLLWLAAPGLAAMSIQYRPDVLLSVLALACGGLAVLGYDRRDPVLLLWASAIAGVALTTKLHAVGLLPMLAVAVVLAGRIPDWRLRVAAHLRRHRLAFVGAGLAWLAICVGLDRSQLHEGPSPKGIGILVAGLVAAGGVALIRPLWGAVAGAYVAGVLAAIVPLFTDGIQSLVWIARALAGGGVNNGASALSVPSTLVHFPLAESLLVLLLAAAAAILGLRGGDARPALWFLAAAPMTLLAMGRLGTTHYFAPGYVLAIVPALGLVRRAGPAAAVALVVVVVTPQLAHLRDAAHTADSTVRQAHGVLRGLRLPREGVAITDQDAPLPDTRFQGLVSLYVNRIPRYPFLTLPVGDAGRWTAAELGLRPTVYLSATPAGSSSVAGYRIASEPSSRPGGWYAYPLMAVPPAPTTRPPNTAQPEAPER